jgi:formate/nitrite transporter FocA (FNT family)
VAYLAPSEFVSKMVDAGESKIFMSTRDTLVRAYMAGAILALAAWFAVTINVQTGQPLLGAVLFPVGFCMLYLFGFDLLTGVFVLPPLALIDKRPASRRAACCATGASCSRQLRRRLHRGRDDGDRHHLRLLHRAQRRAARPSA